MSASAQIPPSEKSQAATKKLSGEALAWIRYLYFLRFSLLLWSVPGLLALLNWKVKALASGLMVPEYFQGYLCVGFFVSCTGYAALASARVTVINGPRRFGEAAPTKLESWLADPAAWREWRAFLLSYLWSAFFLAFLLWMCPENRGKRIHDVYILGQPRAMIFWGYFAGAVAALVFWYVLNAWYYLSYVPVTEAEEHWTDSDSKGPMTEAMRAAPRMAGLARTMVFPRSWFFLDKANLEATELKHPILQQVLRRLAEHMKAVPGYAFETKSQGAHLYEGHVFLLLAGAGFFGLYLAICPITAPVPALGAAVFMLVLSAIVTAVCVREFWSTKEKGKALRFWQLGLTAVALAFWGAVLWLYLCSSAERFPILSGVVIMVIGVLWGLSGIAFFVDRFRIPVLSGFVLNVVLFHWWLPWGLDEHYFSTITLSTPVPVSSLPTPAAVLDERLSLLGADEPLVIVTATGGGLHASAWTAAVLSHLEHAFPQQPGKTFHDRLLVLSTVSGGSVGLNAYLHALRNNSADRWQHMQEVAQCSSLEAVGWGLVYYDAPKAMLPFAPYLLWPSSGNGDLSASPLWTDRTWSLRKGIERNQQNAYCADIWQRDRQSDRAARLVTDSQQAEADSNVPLVNISRLFDRRLWSNLRDERGNEAREKAFTLLGMLPDAATPAFTMNTTSVEVGSRFLLSNYVVPHYVLDRHDENMMYPAQSFLDTFTDMVNANDRSKDEDLVDLPLATAAQLSATFPYVSSTTRAPIDYSTIAGRRKSVHFGDGGYYDNDGTASAVEFLRYALASPEGGSSGADQIHLRHIAEKLADPRHPGRSKPLHVLWIEIRNSFDYDGGGQQQAGGNGGQSGNWTMTDQIGAPLTAFWNAGHESVTGRNRYVLDLLQQAYGCQVSIHRVVIDDENALKLTGTDPLNWSLTPGQRQEIRYSAGEAEMGGKYKQATAALSTWPGPDPCPASPSSQAAPAKH
jgi:hypothetical protein